MRFPLRIARPFWAADGASGSAAGEGDTKTGDAKTADTSATATAGGDGTAAATATADATKTGDTAGDTTAGDSKTGDTDATTAKVPDRYELTLPDGAIADASDLEKVTAYARAQGLTNEQAQEQLVAYDQALRDQSAAFLNALKADQEIGGEQLPQVQARVNALLDRFLPDSEPDGAALRGALTKSGWNHFAPLVKLLARIAKASAEDTPDTRNGGTGATTKRDPAAVLYPSMV